MSDFSLFAGGPLYRIALRMGVVTEEHTLARLGVALALLTWAPLVLLTAIYQVTIGNVAMAFLLSLGTHVRFLLAIPLFFAAEAWTGPRLKALFGQIVESRLVLPAQIPSLDKAISNAIGRRNSVLAETLLLFLTLATMFSDLRTDLPTEVSAWRGAAGGITGAGWWYMVISLPVFQFLCWRWCWRLLIWGALLWQVSRLNLQLVPTHPDLCGGLGYFGIAQSYFCSLSFPVSSVLAASFAERIVITDGHIQSFLRLIACIVFINLLVFLGPLLFFTPILIAVKRQGLREYGVLAATYTRLFDLKWIRLSNPAPGENLLGTADIQSLADIANGFAVIRAMRLVPFGPGTAIFLITAAVAPMLPLLLFEFSLDELLKTLLELFFGT